MCPQHPQHLFRQPLPKDLPHNNPAATCPAAVPMSSHSASLSASSAVGPEPPVGWRRIYIIAELWDSTSCIPWKYANTTRVTTTIHQGDSGP
jgi:hypothetical protein